MQTQKIQVHNRFHGSAVVARVDAALVDGVASSREVDARELVDIVSTRQYRRIERALCGIRGCQCPGATGAWEKI